MIKEIFYYSSGVFSPSAEDCAYNSLGSHAMLVVGYGIQNGEPFWLLKNSWGEHYGENGYIKIKKGVNSCGISEGAVGAYM